jgi:hypothetical protein
MARRKEKGRMNESEEMATGEGGPRPDRCGDGGGGDGDDTHRKSWLGRR